MHPFLSQFPTPLTLNHRKLYISRNRASLLRRIDVLCADTGWSWIWIASNGDATKRDFKKKFQFEMRIDFSHSLKTAEDSISNCDSAIYSDRCTCFFSFSWLYVIACMLRSMDFQLWSIGITQWRKFARTHWNQSLEFEPKIVGTMERPIQIDDSFFSDRRNYGRGRFLKGNIDENRGRMRYWQDNGMGYEDRTDPATWIRVLGIYSRKNEVRFLPLKNRLMDIDRNY